LIPARLVERKRNGEALAPGDLEALFLGYLREEVEEHQMAAFLMAVYFRGLAAEELDSLVSVMLDSGRVLELEGLPGAIVDKHSTGGVGDKVSLALAPLAAELGLYVPMISGRGLGHTGGTLDKLEAIPGFRTDLPLSGFREVLEDVGCAMIGQTAEIAPLDRRLYALRDVTATVSSIPLIAASIMSKKLAEDLTGLVLDVKVGEGAFIPDEAGALELARTLVGIGARRGVHTRALLTAMDRPLGRTVGNALEVAEAIDCLRGVGPPDLRELVLTLAVEMSLAGGEGPEPAEARQRAEAALDGGGALERFRRLVAAQGGDPSVSDDGWRPATAPVTETLRADRDATVRAVTPTTLGYGLIELGGGRKRLGETVDPAVGFVLHAVPGQQVTAGEPLATAHARDPDGGRTGVEILRRAFVLGEFGTGSADPRRPLLSHRVLEDGVEDVRAVSGQDAVKG
jgi:pyrimidine-nucleoside phosphorylase